MITPGLARRQALNKELGSGHNGAPVVSSFFPIERYYDAAEKVLASFQEAYGNKQLDDAYVFGKRYCSFCIESIPAHNYYSSAKYGSLRNRHLKSVNVVLGQLEDVTKWMDAEELVKQRKREAYMRERARLIAEKEEKERQRLEAVKREHERRQLEELERRMQLQLKPSKGSDPGTDPTKTQMSALKKLELLQQSSAPPATLLPQPPEQRSSSRYALSDEEEPELATSDQQGSHGLPPPLLPPTGDYSSPIDPVPGQAPPPPPPSYLAVTQTQPTERRNPFLGPSSALSAQHKSQASLPSPDAGGFVPPPSYFNATGPSTSVSSLPDPPSYGSNPFLQSNGSNHNHRVSQQQLFRQQQQQQPKPKPKRIPVRQMRDTARRDYERLQAEGQIVIRPIPTYQGRSTNSTNGCTVISPLVVSRHLRTGPGIVLPDHEIVEVIDQQCVPLLRQIRGKLGLENHSLIIPSDVHDHLVDENILRQEEFIGATGGNIISVEHMAEVFKLLKEKMKAGAVLFFREHVISIVKIPVGSYGQAYFDFVDSMPGTTDGGKPCATRTRCKDMAALDVLLRWYATKKFTDSNCSHIDRNPWDENMADFDPRVFQVFVWGKDS